MSELSEQDYRRKTREIIDSGIYDPDIIFQKLVEYYLEHDPIDDVFYDTQDDIEELFDGFADILAENFKNQPHGSGAETNDAKRFRQVRNWVEDVHYDSSGVLRKNASENRTNVTNKFNGQMDKVMHLIASAAVAANFGETSADAVSIGAEIGDEIKRGSRSIGNWLGLRKGPTGIGFDANDLRWGLYGSELQNEFDLNSEKKSRKLAVKFGNGTFKLSEWENWYNKSGSKLYE